jgi:hypothetical protein
VAKKYQVPLHFCTKLLFVYVRKLNFYCVTRKTWLGAGLPDGIFQTKIPIWVNFGGPWNGKSVYFYGRLEYITAS